MRRHDAQRRFNIKTLELVERSITALLNKRRLTAGDISDWVGGDLSPEQLVVKADGQPHLYSGLLVGLMVELIWRANNTGQVSVDYANRLLADEISCHFQPWIKLDETVFHGTIDYVGGTSRVRVKRRKLKTNNYYCPKIRSHMDLVKLLTRILAEYGPLLPFPSHTVKRACQILDQLLTGRLDLLATDDLVTDACYTTSREASLLLLQASDDQCTQLFSADLMRFVIDLTVARVSHDRDLTGKRALRSLYRNSPELQRQDWIRIGKTRTRSTQKFDDRFGLSFVVLSEAEETCRRTRSRSANG